MSNGTCFVAIWPKLNDSFLFYEELTLIVQLLVTIKGDISENLKHAGQWILRRAKTP